MALSVSLCLDKLRKKYKVTKHKNQEAHSIYLSLYPSFYRSISIYRSIDLSIYLSIYLSISHLFLPLLLLQRIIFSFPGTYMLAAMNHT